MVEIAIETLRELHYLSDNLRSIFYDMECSEGGETKHTIKTLSFGQDQYKKAAELALKINNIIVDLDAENTKNNILKNKYIDYSKVVLKILEHLNDLQQHHHKLAGKAIQNNKLNVSMYHDELYHEFIALEEYITEDLLQQ